ncbi:tetratricopeptide repeat protein [Paenibacillus sp. TRM 82003]|uniref:tetratricopeptide repeat protein n=1 Tax=Kineococcus sp. TRM81007 TaxID=2925831 RepID=UPI001F5950C7|nr:tetratricopeptide repeat protein [Kineococcus sp. TRM81007]MCI2240513.1 tetratricopeptide repeat protein [Kineococcus sp. TRM81007]MCI3925246.1 tetratricopeptide repeat protein [Paenibacillus sp. TRM 82003]
MIVDLLSFELARTAFDERRFTDAVAALEPLLERNPEDRALRELLARSYFGAAMLGKAEEQARDLVRRAPADGYAHLLLARSLERQSRTAEARGHRVMAHVLGADG